MPAKSKQQQKFFGVVKAMQKGDIPKKGEAGEVADDMNKKEVDKMASTKHKGLPAKIKELIRVQLNKTMTENRLTEVSANALRAKYEKALKKEQTLSSLLLVNLEKYKAAKAKGNEKAIAKHTKIAGQIGKKKAKATKDASAAYKAYEDKISGLHSDAELEIDEARVNEVKAKIEILTAMIDGKDMYSIYVDDEKVRIPGEQWPEFKKMVKLEEGTLTEALARGLKPLLKLGSKVGWNTMSEDALLDLSEKFEEIDDEDADSIASHLNMSIELRQDGYRGDATKKMKQFNKVCADALKGKPIKSAFENVNEATDKFYIKQLTDTFKRFKLDPRKYEIMMDSSFGAGSKIPVLRPKGGFGDGVMIDQTGSADQIELMSSKSGRPIPGKNKFTDIDQAMVAATKYVDNIKEAKLNEMDINDPILVAIRARKTDLKKKAALPKVKKISTKQYYKLMDMESDIIDKMKDAAKEYQRLDSEMNQDAGQKGSNWTDADANRYGGDLDKLQTKIEKLAKQKLKVKKAIMSYRIN